MPTFRRLATPLLVAGLFAGALTGALTGVLSALDTPATWRCCRLTLVHSRALSGVAKRRGILRSSFRALDLTTPEVERKEEKGT